MAAKCDHRTLCKREVKEELAQRGAGSEKTEQRERDEDGSHVATSQGMLATTDAGRGQTRFFPQEPPGRAQPCQRFGFGPVLLSLDPGFRYVRG